MLRLATVLSLAACAILAANYSWQEPHAEVIASGDLRWGPKPFAFTPGPSVRYVDHENGSDTKDDRTQQTAWQHHPWDKLAKGKAAACKGNCFRGAIDFLRIARGTLADAKTTIEELYAWEFDGPQFRDFTGRLPADGKRDAGAIEFSGR